MITVNSTINLTNQAVPPIIPVVQGDTGRAIAFTLVDFTIPAGATATYYVQKPSGEAVYNSAEISGNTVTVELTAQSIIEVGENNLQVRIILDEAVVTSFDVILMVRPFRGIGAVESETEMNIFDKAVEQAKEEIEAAAQEAEEYISQAIDDTLTIAGKAADAKATGDAINDLRADLNDCFIYTDKWEDKTSTLVWHTGEYWWNGHSTVYAQTSWAHYGAVKAGDKVRIRARAIAGVNGIILQHDGVQTVYGPASGYLTTDVEYTLEYNGELYLNTQTGSYIEPSQSIPTPLYQFIISTEKSLHIKSTMTGKKWAVLGDSLCEYNTTAPQNWVRNMIETTGAIVTNLASSGTGFYRGAELNGSTPKNYIAKIASIPSDTEFISICGSFNDTMTSPWPSLPVGTATDTGNESLAGYMNAFFDALITAFPATPIAVAMTSPWDGRHPNVSISDEYVSVLEEICNVRGIPFSKDCYLGCNLKPWITANRDFYYTHLDGSVDGVHPNDKGHLLIFQMLKPFLEKCQYSH